MSYKYGSVALMALLMERKGYNVSDKESLLCFYKYDRQQGSLSKEEVRNKITDDKSVKDINQIRAWLYKYAVRYDSRVGAESSVVYTSKAKAFTSRLTEQLWEKFGLEFVFFSGKEKDKPYGYAIIDHSNKAVYKGSDVLILKLLNRLSSTVAQEVKTGAGEERERVISSGEMLAPLAVEKYPTV